MTTTTWTQAIDSDALNAGNWDNGLPDATVDAIVNSGTAFNLSSSSLTVKTINFTGFTGTCTGNNNAIHVNGNATFSAGMTMTDTSIALDAACTLVSNGQTFRTINGTGALTLGDNLKVANFGATNVVWGTYDVNMTPHGSFVTPSFAAGNTSISYSLGATLTCTIGPSTFELAIHSPTSAQVPPIIINRASGTGYCSVKDHKLQCGGLTLNGGRIANAGASPQTIQTYSNIADGHFSLLGGSLATAPGSQAIGTCVVAGNFYSAINLPGGVWTVSGTADALAITATNANFGGGSALYVTSGTNGGGNTNVNFISPPSAPVVTGISTDSGTSASDGITSDQTLIISGTSDATNTITVYKGGILIGSTVAVAGVWSFDYTGTTLAEGAYTFTAKASDGHTQSAASTGFDVVVDKTGPTITSVTTAHDVGTYTTGEVIDTVVNISETAIKTGSPLLVMLMNGNQTQSAVYQSGSGTNAMTFRFTAIAGDVCNSWRPHAIDLNGGTIKDTAGNDLILTIPSADTSIADIGLSDATGYLDNPNHRGIGRVR